MGGKRDLDRANRLVRRIVDIKKMSEPLMSRDPWARIRIAVFFQRFPQVDKKSLVRSSVILVSMKISPSLAIQKKKAGKGQGHKAQFLT